MDKAFDSVFQREVDALELSKSIEPLYGTQFRYQCLCCGEEVFLAAAESSEKSPHFRHRRGNNDIECERYLGQPGALEHYVSIRKHTMDSIGFCFNIDHMTFEISLTLSDKDISNYAENGGQFSLHTKYNALAFFSMPINRGTDAKDVVRSLHIRLVISVVPVLNLKIFIRSQMMIFQDLISGESLLLM